MENRIEKKEGFPCPRAPPSRWNELLGATTRPRRDPGLGGVTCLALAGAVKASASSGSQTICPTARLSNVLPIQTSIYKMSTDTFASMYSISFRYKCLNE